MFVISRNASTLVYVSYKKWESNLQIISGIKTALHQGSNPVSATVISNPPGDVDQQQRQQHTATPQTPPLAKVPSHRGPSSHFHTPHIFLKVTLPQNLIVGLSPKSRETSKPRSR